MFTRIQNQLFNRLMSDSHSDCVPEKSTKVALFLPNADMIEVLKNLGFTQEIKRCNFQNDAFGHSMWWHEDCKVLVTFSGKKWTFANEENPMFLADLDQPR